MVHYANFCNKNIKNIILIVLLFDSTKTKNLRLTKYMFSDKSTETRILILGDQTIVINREKENPMKFRILVDSAFRGYLEHISGSWQLSKEHSINDELLCRITETIGTAKSA